MGGCCCTPHGPPTPSPSAINYCPIAFDEHAPHQETVPMLPLGLTQDVNLDTSISGTYRPPPAPLPYDIVLGLPQAPVLLEKATVNHNDSAIGTTNSDSTAEVAENPTKNNLVKCEDLKLTDCKGRTDFDLDTEKDEIELAKSAETIISSPDECPTCLEEYDDDNPKIITKCDHHFHLACIFEWLERSDTCPVCDKVLLGFTLTRKDAVLLIPLSGFLFMLMQEMVFDAPLAS